MPFLVRLPADVVQQKNIDVGNAQASQTRFEGAPHAITAVIEHGAASLHRKPIIARGPALLVLLDAPTHLGGDDEGVSRLSGQHPAHTLFAKPMPIEWCGVKIADAPLE